MGRVVGGRVARCSGAEETADGPLRVLGDLWAWQPGAARMAAARLLAGMHRQWESRAPARWPWLRPTGSGADLVAALFGQAWPRLAGRRDLPAGAPALRERLAGRAPGPGRARSRAGPPPPGPGGA